MVLVCLALGTESTLAEEPWRIGAPGRLVAVSDIHGAYDGFVEILTRSGVIDGRREWVGGDTRLIVVGDVLDRGPEARRVLDLIIALRESARAKGGEVHFVLGNHEIMNIVGDLRYVPAEEFAEFADSEPQDVRAAAFARFLAQRGAQTDAARAELEFDNRYPPGFFAHRRAYSSEGRYGAWLLDQPILLIAGRTVFVHGGLSQAYAGTAGDEINSELKGQLRDYVAAMETLIELGILSPTDDFYDHPAIVDRYRERVALGEAVWPPGAEAAADQIATLNDAPVFALGSPVWYRGMVSCSPLVERDDWEASLSRLGAERIVVGHTPTPDARILTRMDGGIVRIDTGMLASYYDGRPAALIVDSDGLHAVYADAPDAVSPIPQPRRVGDRPGQLTDEQLESLLRDAPIVAQTSDDERARVTLRRGDIEVDADFYPARRPSVRPAVAAYRLDRLLGLGMVPVTVARDLDGTPGALQFAPADLMTETERRALQTGAAAWCPLAEQYPAMYLFDTLIFNEARTLEQIGYDKESFGLVLLGQEETFGTQRGRPRHLEAATLPLNKAWRDALARLDDDGLEQTLGDVLSSRQIRALRRRADALIEEAGPP